jgi:argininosuccinate lyase
VFGALPVARSVGSRTSFGGTAPVNVKRQIAFWKKRLGKVGIRAREG